jgi:hypothetical protein
LDEVKSGDGENPKRCQATAVQETRIRPEFLENDHLRVFASSRETLSPSALQPLGGWGGRAAHLFSIHPDTSAAAFKTIQPFFNGGL